MGKLFGDNLFADQSRLINKDRIFCDSGFTCGSDTVMPRNNFNLVIYQDAVGDRLHLPAVAEVVRQSSIGILHPWVYPRVGGGTIKQGKGGRWRWGLSPRGRGNPGLERGQLDPYGSIPAWAGEPSSHVSSRVNFTVYPRVGGGTRLPSGLCWRSLGLSPRGRGNPYFANTNKVGISPKPIIGTSPSLLSDG